MIQVSYSVSLYLLFLDELFSVVFLMPSTRNTSMQQTDGENIKY